MPSAPRRFPAVSGVRISRYALVRRCLQSYLSPILVDSILTKAMAAAGVSDRAETDELMPKIVEHAMSGLKLFVEPARHSELMARLRLLARPEGESTLAGSETFPAKRSAG